MTLQPRKAQILVTEKGFTLIELILVIIIASILAALVMQPKMNKDIVGLDTQVQRLLGDVRYVQALSLYSNQCYRLDFSHSSYYQILDSTGNPISYAPVGGVLITLDSGTMLTTNNSNRYLIFDGLGVPYASATANGSGVVLIGNYRIRLANASGNKSVRVRWETGTSWAS